MGAAHADDPRRGLRVVGDSRTNGSKIIGGDSKAEIGVREIRIGGQQRLGHVGLAEIGERVFQPLRPGRAVHAAASSAALRRGQLS